MARNRTRLPAIASIDFLYSNVDEMPWEEIEDAAGKSFTVRERREIHACADKYSWAACWLRDAPPYQEFENLRKNLLDHCNALCALAEQYRPLRDAREVRADHRVLDALNVIHMNRDFILRDEFHKLAIAARNVQTCLNAEPELPLDTTQRLPETAGLEAFLAAILEDAEAIDARCNLGYQEDKRHKEYRRWGISVGARCNGFPEFVSTVLRREVSSNQLRKSWPSMWWETAKDMEP